MENLKKIISILENKSSNFSGDYWIPVRWNSFGFKNLGSDSKRDGEICINPYEFSKECILKILNGTNENEDYLCALQERVDITKSVIYSILPRMFTAWNHYDDNVVQGSFLKAIWLLPYLKKLNVNIIYLLPIFKYSNVNKKGDLGSPYAIKDIYSVSDDLHDELLGDDKSFVDVEFKAFVEACHILKINVMLDFVFRTVARDSDWMIKHPDWFYWIDKSFEKDFEAPHIEGVKKPTPVNRSNIKYIYESENLKNYLAMFKPSPEKIDEKKWQGLLERQRETSENILALIEEEFGITTVPGFSDVINDPQPPWSDVTYVKMYFGLHKKAEAKISENQPDYMLYDLAKSSVAGGQNPNKELWELILEVMPYYQKNFGIDGARIDMGHALPRELNIEMISRVKKNNKNFLLWSEEFHAKNSLEPKESGFHFMTGGLWMTYPKVEKAHFYDSLMKDLLNAKLPISAALESHDTPRAACLFKERKALEFMIGVNAMLPNSVLFINNGFEIMEIQPMNLGLGNTIEGRYVLPKNDPMYGKLALFDSYKLHWTKFGVDFIYKLIEDFAKINKRYKKLLCLENFIKSYKNESSRVLSLVYKDNETNEGLVFVGNRMKRGDVSFKLSDLLTNASVKEDVTIIYKDGSFCDLQMNLDEDILLTPKEYFVVKI